MFFFIRIASVLLLMQVLPAIYLYFRYLRRKPRMRNILIWTVVLLVMGTVWYISYGFRTGRPEWLCHLFFHLLLGISMAGILFCLCDLIALAIKKIPFLPLSVPSFPSA